MTAVITYIATFEKLPELDRQGRPKMFYSQRIHDKCYRRPHFDAGQFVEAWDDDSARKGYCLYKMGCKVPTTYNACSSTRWYGGVSFPIQSGHGCIGCSEDGFWDNGSFYSRLTNINQFGIEANADEIGLRPYCIAKWYPYKVSLSRPRFRSTPLCFLSNLPFCRAGCDGVALFSASRLTLPG